MNSFDNSNDDGHNSMMNINLVQDRGIELSRHSESIGNQSNEDYQMTPQAPSIKPDMDDNDKMGCFDKI